jgi:hypothetical protein
LALGFLIPKILAQVINKIQKLDKTKNNLIYAKMKAIIFCGGFRGSTQPINLDF